MNKDIQLIFEAYKEKESFKERDFVKINWFSKKEDTAKEVQGQVVSLTPLVIKAGSGETEFQLKKDGYYYMVIPGVKQVTKYSITYYDPNDFDWPTQHYGSSWASQLNEWYQKKLKPVITDALKSNFKIGSGGFKHGRLFTVCFPKDPQSDIKKVVLDYERLDTHERFLDKVERKWPRINARVYLNEFQTPEMKARMMLAGAFLGGILGSMPDGEAHGDDWAKTFKEHISTAVENAIEIARARANEINKKQ